MFLAACLLCYKPATILSSQHSARPCQARGEGGSGERARGSVYQLCPDRRAAPIPGQDLVAGPPQSPSSGSLSAELAARAAARYSYAGSAGSHQGL